MSICKKIYSATVFGGTRLTRTSALLAIVFLANAGAAWGSMYTPPDTHSTVPYVYAYASTPDGEDGPHLRTDGFVTANSGVICDNASLFCGGPPNEAGAGAEARALWNELGAASIGGDPGAAGGESIAIAWFVDFAEFDYQGSTDAYFSMRTSLDGYVDGFASASAYLALEPPATEPYTCEVVANQEGYNHGSCIANMLVHPGLNQFQIQLRLEVASYADFEGSGFADFTHTALIDSVFLQDLSGNEITPITLQTDSGTVYGATATTPEPASLLLVGCGLVGIGCWRRRFATKFKF